MLSSYIGINFVLTVTSLIFFIGLFGIILNRKNTLMIIMSIEVLLLSVNLNFAALSIYLDDILGHVFVFFVLTIAAAESAIGLSILTSAYKLKSTSIRPTIVKKELNKTVILSNKNFKI